MSRPLIWPGSRVNGERFRHAGPRLILLCDEHAADLADHERLTLIR